MKFSNDDPVFEVHGAVGDPRNEDSGVHLREVDLDRRAAISQARAFAAHGYHASVYAPDGECVFELKGE